jgi:hypothetical protein
MKRIACAVLLALAAGCAGKPHDSAHAQTATPQPAATLLIESRGVAVPLTKAVHEIAFRPFIPGAQIAEIALIPPLGGEDKRETHGLAIEYANRGNALLLSQWPRAGFHIAMNGADITQRPCAPVAFKTDGLIWTTRNGLVMTLQPDGAVSPALIEREAHRLIAAGACRAAD